MNKYDSSTIPRKTAALAFMCAVLMLFFSAKGNVFNGLADSRTLMLLVFMSVFGWMIARVIICRFKNSLLHRLWLFFGIFILICNAVVFAWKHIFIDGPHKFDFETYGSFIIILALLWFLYSIIIDLPTRRKRLKGLQQKVCSTSVDSLLLCSRCQTDMTQLSDMICPKCGKKYMLRDLLECNAERVNINAMTQDAKNEA